MLLLIALGLAHAQDTGFDPAPPPIVSGSQVPQGRFDDAAAVLAGGEYLCGGVLVGPKTVITAAQCAPEATHVIVGSKDWTTAQGELLPVRNFRMFDLYQGEGMDLAILRLTRASEFAPRPIAGACSQEFIVEGGDVSFVGFGALRAEEVDPNTRLNEAFGEIVKVLCDNADGCDEDAPGLAEFIAGDEGVGPCVGDEGSPAYLVTPYGDVLLGIASRNTVGATQECGDPSIFTRIDTFRGWLEEWSEDELPYALCPGSPELTIQPFDPIATGGSGRTTFTVTDPDHDSSEHTFFFPSRPAHGSVDLLAGNRLRYNADRGYIGTDSFTLEVTDPDGNGAVVKVEVEVVHKGFLGCGCNATPAPTGWLAMLLGPALVVSRRRRRG
ncbi:MAG: trypsin-like serine protease [Deltaproteobacteria bacterium]|nr:MAG: trypsin-like serine protease [Deltaproteobacteria bacterium]